MSCREPLSAFNLYNEPPIIGFWWRGIAATWPGFYCLHYNSLVVNHFVDFETNCGELVDESQFDSEFSKGVQLKQVMNKLRDK